MSDFNSPSSPDADPRRNRHLPARRDGDDSPHPPPDGPAEPISLEEMMERLQRSGESRSGRRRRSSSSSSRSSASSRTPENLDPARPAPSGTDSFRPAQRAVLPPPRGQDRGVVSAKDRPRPQPQARRRRWWLIALVALVVLAGAAWVGLRLLNRWRIEGEGFRVNAARRVSELVDRRVSFARFRHTGSDRLGNASMALIPVHQDLLESATLSDLTAQFSAGSWLADDWTIRSLRLSRADLVFQPGKKLDAQTIWQTAAAPVDRGVPDNGGIRLGMTSDPAAVIVESGRFDQLNLSWPDLEGKPESLTNLEGNFRLADHTVHLEMAGGLLDTAAWPPFPVRQVNARLRGTTLEIISARLGFTADHEVRLSGSAELVPTGQLQLQADISPILLKHLLPESWVHSVLGSFDASNAQWLSHFQSGPPPTLSGPFRVKGLVLRGFPFVEKIASLLRKPDLALMEFPILTGKFAWTPQATHLTDLSASTLDDLLRLKGNVSISPGEKITGRLTIEANEAFFAGLPPSTPTLFTPTSNDWRTLSFALSGGENAVTDSIAIAQPIIINSRPPSLPGARLPDPTPAIPDRSAPAPSTPGIPGAPGAAPPGTPRPAVPAPLPAAPSPPRQPTDAELERSLNDILGR